MELEIVTNEPRYWSFIRKLRNNPAVNNGFINTHEITAEEHDDYMCKNGHMFDICISEQIPVGYIRVDEQMDISICVSPQFHKNGVGTRMLRHIIKKYPNSVAKIKIENKASLALFEKCGFKKRYYLLEQE